MLRQEKANIMEELTHYINGEIEDKCAGGRDPGLKKLEEMVEDLQKRLSNVITTIDKVDQALGTPTRAKKETATKG